MVWKDQTRAHTSVANKLNYAKLPFPSTLTNISFTLNVNLVKSQSLGTRK
jgi:hypothetical protein